MPTQINFRSDITTPTDTRFQASRIVKFPEEGVLLETLPASFGFGDLDNIEIHFYTVSSNIKVFSTVVRLDDPDVLKSHVVSYDDGTFKNYIRIDFTKLFEIKQQTIIPGNYKMVLNFFMDEIGTYNNKNLYIQQISDTRTEVQLGFIDNTTDVKKSENEKMLYEFIPVSFDKPTTVGVTEKIFKSGVEMDDSTEGLTYENVVENIQVSTINQTYDNTIARVQRLGLEGVFKTSVNNFLLDLFENIKNEIIISGDDYIQVEEFETFIKKIVAERINMFLTDNRINIS